MSLHAPGLLRGARSIVRAADGTMHKRWSVRTYLGWLALAVAGPCAVALVYSIASDRQHDQKQVQAATLNLAQLVASQTQQFLTDAENVSAKLAQRPLIAALDRLQRDPIFDQFLDLYPQFANLVACDLEGKVIHSAVAMPPGLALETIRARWSQAVVHNGRFTVGKPILGELSRRWVCVLGQPIKDRQGRVIGALGMSVDLARFHVGVSPVKLPTDSSITILDQDGVIIMRSPGSQMWVGRAASDDEVSRRILGMQEGNLVGRGVDHEERIYGFTTIDNIGWHVYAGIPTAFALADTRLNTLRASLLGVALLGLAIAGVLYVGRLITEPVSALCAATSAAAEGKLQQPVTVTGPKEIAAVATQFNRMLAGRQQKEAEIQNLNSELEQRVKARTGELESANAELQKEIRVRQHAQEAVRAQQAELQDYIDSMSTLNAKIALDGTLLLVNKIAQQAAGIPLEALLKIKFLDGNWWTFDAQVHERVKAAFAAACSGTAVNYDEKLFVFGRVIDIHFSLIPVRAPGGRVAYLVAEARDITQRKAAEAALAEQTRQLEITNKELEAFSYSVSHDLRAPLRGIDGFTKALAEDYGDRLDEEGKAYLERVRASALRMSQLIDDLLKLSRISRGELRWEEVDLSAIAGEIAQSLRETAPRRSVDFALQPGLRTRGDSRLLRVVLENLLSNAFKFTREKGVSRIEFGATQLNGQKTFFVRDNGAGFDMTYKDKLFGAFQRLHSPEEYEGTGIGLATVQRILHRHGGRAWGEGKEASGATFYFALPG